MLQKLTLSLLALLLAASVHPASDPVRKHIRPVKTNWKITGQLVEACSCNAACPCWFGSMPSRMACSGNQVVFIKSGRYGSVPLDGLAVAQFVKSPDGKSMLESFGSWDLDSVYIDERANPQQRAALVDVAKHLFAPSAKSREIRYVPISRRMEGKEFLVSVGKVSDISGHLIDGGFTGAPKIVNPPLADPTHRSFQQGVATRLTFTDMGQNWDFKNTNFMVNDFTVDNAEYEKYEAAMAEKMKKANKPH
ncbi:DUF1326 domain-containing protein [Fimbriimonas ginsengisoli]|uniref:DUF1326 domain-containing protein n=1 Tax=Fimbriimonas ginsengisoli TaxID=1005039 RepID=UPI0003E95C98|nr:DUF1326 domain-containing protein [Fimbriimonas ginsengisoli]